MDIVRRVVLEQMAAVHLRTGLEHDKFESRAQMVEGGSGATEHVDGIFEFFLEILVGFVCWEESAKGPLKGSRKENASLTYRDSIHASLSRSL